MTREIISFSVGIVYFLIISWINQKSICLLNCENIFLIWLFDTVTYKLCVNLYVTLRVAGIERQQLMELVYKSHSKQQNI